MRGMRNPKLGSKYYLPKHEYLTVVNFCLNYTELKAKLATLDGWHSHVMDGMPHGTGTSDPTQKEAIERSQVSAKIHTIESTVLECAGEVLYEPMLAAVTEEGATIEDLRRRYELPVSRNGFIVLRRKIYFEIAQKI